MNILVLGSGGREHALAHALRKCSSCEHIFVAPGNAGTAHDFINIDLEVTDFEAIAKFASEFNVMMIVVGPEAPLAAGITDYFEQHEVLHSIFVVGPGRNGAQLESSKQFAKAFLQRHHIPTARYQAFTAATLEQGVKYLEQHQMPVVLKADGLAGGKGVLIAQSADEATRELREMLTGQKFGEAGSKVVVEEFLHGTELSVFILTDGTDYVLLPEAKDYKRVGEGDTGLNTGGMGAVSPVPFADAAFMERVRTQIIEPTLRGLQQDQISYNGFLFIGLMKVGDQPYVIEYNVRLGDPETEAVLPRLRSDFFELLRCLHDHSLASYQLEVDPRTAATVVLTSGGYPGPYETGIALEDLDRLAPSADLLLFHAGTELTEDEQVITSGGRVLAVTGLGANLAEALQLANAAAEQINFQGKSYRKDIGFDLQSKF